MEHGETIKGCASREVREETGLEVSDADFLAITEDIFEEEEKHYITVWVTCQKLKSAAKVEVTFFASSTTFYTNSSFQKCMEPLKCTEWSWLSLSDCQNSRAWSAATEEYHELFLPVQNLLKEQKHLVENIIKSMN